MTAYKTDEEQVEDIKVFFKRHGMTLLTAIMLVIAGYFGWQAWQGKQQATRERAAHAYAQLTLSMSNEDNKAVQQRAEYIVKEFPGTGYADLSRLVLARHYVLEHKIDASYQQLKKLSEQTKQDAMRDLAYVRMVRLMIGQKKYSEATELLKKIKGDAYLSVKEITQGDILMAQGKRQAARKAYKTALKHLPQGSSMRDILIAKYNNLAAVEEHNA